MMTRMILPERSKEEWHTLFVVCLLTSAGFALGSFAAFVAALVMLSLPVLVLCVVLGAGGFALAVAAVHAGVKSTN